MQDSTSSNSSNEATSFGHRRRILPLGDDWNDDYSSPLTEKCVVCPFNFFLG